MVRALVLLLIGAALGCAATVRLYMKDGEYQLVREYKVLSDRVRYFSTERGEWEEIPLELVDLKRTETENKQKDEALKQEAEIIAAEDKAEREAAEEVAKVPQDTGVYLVKGKDLKTIPAAEMKLVSDKKRSILKALSPIPMVSGRGTVELDGERSVNVVDSSTPEFYIRLTQEQQFGIVRVERKKGASRIVEKFDIIPVSKEIIEQQDEVAVFRRQVGPGLYKIWPMKALQGGEYAVVEFSPATMGSINMQIWDFNVPDEIGSKEPIERPAKSSGDPLKDEKKKVEKEKGKGKK